MFPEWGFVDTLGQFSSINHDSGLIAFAANPYARDAEPALDGRADRRDRDVRRRALEAREGALWLAWPIWVGFAVISTGNHYWLDVVAGFVLAIVTGRCVLQPRRRYAAARGRA